MSSNEVTLSELTENMIRALLSALPDKGAIKDIIFSLRSKLRGTPDAWMLKSVYQELIQQGFSQYEGYLLELEHDLDPSLPYTEDVFLRLIELGGQDDPVLLAMMVKAVQSNGQLFENQTKLLRGLLDAKRTSKDASVDITMWLAVLEIDPRMSCDQAQVDRALSLLYDNMDAQTESYILVRYLDRVAHLTQLEFKRREYQKALDLLKGCGAEADWAYYREVFAVCEAEYSMAYQSFCGADDRRCRLAQAYCLINGMGTEVDHQTARAILKDYPEDGYALYLLASSLYKCRENRSTNPPEVSELLEESYRLGYKPAKGTSFLMVLDGINRGGEPLSVNELCKQAFTYMSPNKDGLINGSICYMAYMYLIGQFGKVMKKRSVDMISGKRIQSVSLAMLAFSAHCDYVSPISAYLRGTFFQLTMEDDVTKHWVSGLNCLNQSPFVRRWALNQAFLNAWMCGHENLRDTLLSYFVAMGTTEEDMRVISAALTLKGSGKSAKLPAAQTKEFCEFFDKPDASPLTKLLLAGIYANQDEFHNKEFVRKLIEETRGVDDELLVELRSINILAAQLQDEYEDEIVYNDFSERSPDWLENFIGYNFLDYNG